MQHKLAIALSSILSLSPCLAAPTAQGEVSVSGSVRVDFSPSPAQCITANDIPKVDYKSCAKVLEIAKKDPVWKNGAFTAEKAGVFKGWHDKKESCVLRIGATDKGQVGTFVVDNLDIAEWEIETDCPDKGGRVYLTTQGVASTAGDKGWYLEALDKKAAAKEAATLDIKDTLPEY